MVLVYPQIITGADLLRGIVKLDELAPLLQRRGARFVGIANSKLYGVRSFYKMLTKYGVRPVIGLSVNVALSDHANVLVYVYAKNNEGYKNLMKMSSAASTKDDELLPVQWLHAYKANCIVICPLTDHTWAGNRHAEALTELVSGQSTDGLYIGISRAGGEVHQEEEQIIQLAQTFDLPIVASYETRFIQPDDLPAYEVALAIRHGYKLTDANKPPNRHRNAYLPSEEELVEWYADQPTWLERLEQLFSSCQVTIQNETHEMPLFPVPAGMTAIELLTKHCIEGLEQRRPGYAEDYAVRLQYELSIIEQMGFVDYFLIVEDYVAYAKEQQILVGPGRGSSAGSLVAYVLGITEVDPLQYGLLFERFLNPERITMPDIDIDFADHRRSEVIEYVASKYGKQHAAQIITFGTLSTKAVARNVARVLDFSGEEMSFVANELSRQPSHSFKEAASRSRRLQEWVAQDRKREVWKFAAERLEDLPRNASTHAAGVVLSARPLVNRVPLQTGTEEVFLTQWAMKDVEEAGLLKMDFLGLRNLTLLDRIRSMIQYDRQTAIDFRAIPLDDRNTYQLFKSGDMTGIFQFESAGMRQALRLIKPDHFADLFSISALYRPGPMEFIPLYAQRKHGEAPVTYILPELEPILSETYGIIIYQEQIMKIAVEIAGFSIAEADLLRRAISKKNHQTLQQERLHFTNGAIKKGIDAQKANEVYNLIVKFADYGFPKSHAVAYTLISYRLAYFKANEPAYFYAALLSSLSGNKEKIMEVIREAKDRGVAILPPSITTSRYSHTVEGGAIRLGISAVKGVPFSFYQSVKEARQQGKRWTSLFDFALAVGGEAFTEKAVVPLIKSGALDEFGQTRSVLLASIDAAKSHALFIGNDFLSEELQFNAQPKYNPASDMPHMTLLEFEREVLGFYLSDHPVEQYKRNSGRPFETISSLREKRPGERTEIAGIILDVKRIRTKKGEAMAFAVVQDETEEISCTFFPKQYAAASILLKETAFVQVTGTVDIRNGAVQLVVDQTAALDTE